MWCATVVTAVKQSFFGLWATSIASFLTPTRRTSFWKTCEFALKKHGDYYPSRGFGWCSSAKCRPSNGKILYFERSKFMLKSLSTAGSRKSLLRENFEWLVIRNHFGNYFTEIYHRVAASTLGKCIGPTIVCYSVIQKLFSSARLGFIGDSVPPWNLWCRWIQGRTWRCSHVDLQSQGLPWCWCYLEQSH